MPLEYPELSLDDRVAQLNKRGRFLTTQEMLGQLLEDPGCGPIALVSSFGAESAVLLHMIAQIDTATPVIFLDTEMLFAETIEYQQLLAQKFGLSDVRRITPARAALFERDSENLLHRHNRDACCALRKSEPLEKALKGFDIWISGRKRFQGGVRKALALFENEQDQRIKFNPLAGWDRADIAAYFARHDLPRHPLVSRGFRSIGCAPCTTPVRPGEDERAGRWRGAEKTECGIHLGPQGAATANVVMRDSGFAGDDWQGGFHDVEEIANLPLAETAALAIDLPNDFDATALLAHLHEIDLVRVNFPAFNDGRGFSLARQLRLLGFCGRLRAKGLLADQYAMARRCGFDEVEISPELAARQDEPQWLARANWQAGNYQQRLNPAMQTSLA